MQIARVTAAFVMLGSPAWAGLVDSCEKAFRDGDLAHAQSIARVMARREFHYGSAKAERAIGCLDEVTGQKHYFDRSLGRLIPESQRPLAEVEKADRAAQEAADVAARKAQEEAGAAEKERVDQFRAEGARLRRMREAEVTERLSEGCASMYRRDPDATITNQLCFDLFFRTGLPD